MKPYAYYNEFDPKAAAWLRELISAGHIAPGDVDERSIAEVQPSDLLGFTQCHFFAGIGGWSLALRLAGWPDDRPVWTGSCPCQPFSVAGKGLGEADERHLWPEFKRLIAARNPAVTFGEQVASKDGRDWLVGVRADLEELGYEVGGADLCAAGIGQKAFQHEAEYLRWCVASGDSRTAGREQEIAAFADYLAGIIVGAPHIRQRLYWVAHANGLERSGSVRDGDAAGRGGSADNSATRGLAIANGRHASAEGLQRSRQHGQQPSDGGVDRLEYSSGNGREQRRSESSGRSVVGGCGDDSGRLADSKCAGLEGHARDGDNGNQPGWIDAEPTGSIASSGSAGHWSRFDILPCRDGKARRVESGTFPLVAGLPRGVVPSGDPSLSEVQATAEGRVMRLRGYGNSIVPALAAEFIQASLEAIESL